jgi:hypothetical protein
MFIVKNSLRTVLLSLIITVKIHKKIRYAAGARPQTPYTLPLPRSPYTASYDGMLVMALPSDVNKTVSFKTKTKTKTPRAMTKTKTPNPQASSRGGGQLAAVAPNPLRNRS